MAKRPESKKNEPRPRARRRGKSSDDETSDLLERFTELEEYDKRLRSDRVTTLAGVDEAGRGALAGPVSAAAVVLPSDSSLRSQLLDVDDSKQLPEDVREALFDRIVESAVAIGIAFGQPDLIDRENILRATLITMHRAVGALGIKPDLVLIDGRDAINYDTWVVPVVKGDGRSLSIAAASILAKVARDRVMRKLDRRYPGYNFVENKGYGTKDHVEAITSRGSVAIHRKSFHLKVIENNLALF